MKKRNSVKEFLFCLVDYYDKLSNLFDDIRALVLMLRELQNSH